MPTSISVKDAGGSSVTVATNDAITERIGEVQASPTSNTLLDRLKTLSTLIGEVAASPTSNTLLDRAKVLNTTLTATNALIGEVQASPTSNTLLDRLKTINTTLGTTLNAALTPKTSGGLSVHRSIDLDESEEEVKASAGQLYGVHVFNAAASARYVKFYNAAAADVTVGTTTPVLTFPVAAGATLSLDFPNGVAFSTAICAAATTGLADNDTGAPANNDVIVNITYK